MGTSLEVCAPASLAPPAKAPPASRVYQDAPSLSCARYLSSLKHTYIQQAAQTPPSLLRASPRVSRVLCRSGLQEKRVNFQKNCFNDKKVGPSLTFCVLFIFFEMEGKVKTAPTQYFPKSCPLSNVAFFRQITSIV